jgi:hypothetical protein
MGNLVNINVSVPEDCVADVYAYVAGLITGGALNDTYKDTSSNGKRAAAGFGRDTVRKHYFGGQSDHWRPFLDALAEHAGDWVGWHDLCSTIGLTPRKASGMLGAAERRCKGKPPYEKAVDGDDRWFRMPIQVAGYVKEAAAELE